MKITIEELNETTTEVEVTYFIDNGDLKTILIDRDALIKDIEDNDLNVWCEDKWNYQRGEHYTVDHTIDPEDYLYDNIKDIVLCYIEAIERGKELVK